jgi:hypothetical protein
MLKPFNNVLAKYKILIMKMSQYNINVVQARLNLNLLCDLHILPDLSYLLPLLEVVNIFQVCSKKEYFHLQFCNNNQDLSN